MRFKKYSPGYDSYNTFTRLCKEGTWQVLNQPNQLSGIIPEDLLKKAHSIVLMSAASSPQQSVFVANINRVDKPASAVDQEPFIAVFDHSSTTASGGFVHHGNWPGRTDKPGPAFLTAIAASGINTHFPLSEMPTSGSGLLNELKVDSQNQAFWTALSALKDTYEQ
jgi:hypothetical protein